MSFDFSAWLVLFTFVSGVIWAVDAFFLAPRRRRLAEPEPGADEKPVREPILVEYARSFFPVFLIVLILRS
ncbi:MAG: signal peptidase I, partial [Gammaproteobacteria bacterium]